MKLGEILTERDGADYRSSGAERIYKWIHMRFESRVLRAVRVVRDAFDNISTRFVGEKGKQIDDLDLILIFLKSIAKILLKYAYLRLWVKIKFKKCCKFRLKLKKVLVIAIITINFAKNNW